MKSRGPVAPAGQGWTDAGTGGTRRPATPYLPTGSRSQSGGPTAAAALAWDLRGAGGTARGRGRWTAGPGVLGSADSSTCDLGLSSHGERMMSWAGPRAAAVVLPPGPACGLCPPCQEGSWVKGQRAGGQESLGCGSVRVAKALTQFTTPPAVRYWPTKGPSGCPGRRVGLGPGCQGVRESPSSASHAWARLA